MGSYECPKKLLPLPLPPKLTKPIMQPTPPLSLQHRWHTGNTDTVDAADAAVVAALQPRSLLAAMLPLDTSDLPSLTTTLLQPPL
eukprot:6191019-Pleurochrysis_carterae.AAC.1